MIVRAKQSSLLASIAGVGAAIYSMLLSAENFGKSLNQTAENFQSTAERADEKLEKSLEQQRLAASFAFMERWNEPSFSELIRGLGGVFEEVRKPENLERANPFEDKPQYLVTIIAVLNFFEEMAIATEKNHADEEVLRKFFRSIVSQSWASLSCASSLLVRSTRKACAARRSRRERARTVA